MCLTYLHALMLLRSGVRKWNPAMVSTAKLKLYPLFFAGNHPIYQNIIFKDELDNILMPTELKELKNKYISVSRTGNKGHYQGGDALLEEVNKESKAWCKLGGIPTESQWIRVFRKLDKLNEVKHIFFWILYRIRGH